MTAVNRLILAAAADQCARWLKVQGLQVLHVAARAGQPCLTVRYNELCERFEDAVHCYERSNRKERRYAYVQRFGCIVEWQTGGAR